MENTINNAKVSDFGSATGFAHDYFVVIPKLLILAIWEIMKFSGKLIFNVVAFHPRFLPAVCLLYFAIRIYNALH